MPNMQTQLEALAALHSPSSPSCNGRSHRFQTQCAEASSSCQHNSRSLSPMCDHFCLQSSQQGSVQTSPLSSNSSKPWVKRFSSDADKLACPTCLGRHPHCIHQCNDPKLWDGTPAYVRRNSKGRLVDPNGKTLCSDWQKPNGCTLSHRSAKHECLGCGNPGHGAQYCRKAQPQASANSL